MSRRLQRTHRLCIDRYPQTWPRIRKEAAYSAISEPRVPRAVLAPIES